MKSTLTLVACLASVLTINAAANLDINNTNSNTDINEAAITHDAVINNAPIVNSVLTPEEAQRILVLDEEAQQEMANYDVSHDALANDIINYATSFKGTPYKWGSTGPKSFDCSGFTGYVFKNYGIKLDRTSRQQFLQGTKVSRNDLRPGDLVFFSGRGGGSVVGHVGMVSEIKPDGKVQFIHSSTKRGVIHSYLEESYYNKHYLGARRIINS